MVIQTEYEFILPKGYVDENGNLHRKGVMRLATAADEILPLADPRVKQNPDSLIVILLCRVINKLGDIPSISTKTIEDLFAEDLEFLQDFYNKINSKSRAIVAKCPSCKMQFKVANMQYLAKVNSSSNPLPVLKRNNYYFGKLLTPTDFQTEQNYFINKQRLINRTLLGMGVIEGFKIAVDDSNFIQVSGGFALDGYGREIVLTKPLSLQLSNIYTAQEEGKRKELFVYIQYEEIKAEPIPKLQNLGVATTEYNMVVEGAKAEISVTPPDSSLDKLALAKVTIKMEKGKIMNCSITYLATMLGKS
jgi:hypothetical protein